MLGFLPTWLLDLPKPLESQFWQEMRTYEEERKMPYGYTIERVGYDRGEVVGQEKGQVKLILRQLDHKFGFIPQESIEQVRALNLKRIKSLSLALLDFGSIADLEMWLANQA
jgi:Domain of unknown function (DUF4351)